MAKEKVYNIRSEIVSQFKNDSSDQGVALIKKALKDDNFNVRRAALDHTGHIVPSLLADYEKLLSDTSYVTIESALRKLTKQYPNNTRKYLNITKNTIGISKNVRIAWLELSAEDNEEAKNELIDYTSHSYEFRTRVKAMEAMERLDESDEALIKNLFDAIINPNTRLAGPAEKTLRKLTAKADVKEMVTTLYKAGIWKDWQQEKLRTILEL